ncbi:MAG: hypothetical protein QG594_2147 [Bacteroidota bacterium]|nr:hypothetical protein [Bacteroidota bacterium]
MPILDKFGNEILHHIEFPNDTNVHNIEFGAGKNNFGKREYPNCFLTDLEFPDFVLHFKQDIDYSNSDCHYLDGICDFYDYNFNRKFENIILCNPFGYGYKGLGDAKFFFNRAGDILTQNGKIHIVGKSNNDWCKKDSFDKFIKNEIEVFKSKYDFELETYELLDSNHEINIKYKFYQTGLKRLTEPNERLIIKKL